MTRNPADLLLNEHLDYLKLTSVKENCQPLAVESAANHWSHLDYLGRLLQGEVAARQQRTIARRIKQAQDLVERRFVSNQTRCQQTAPSLAQLGFIEREQPCRGLIGVVAQALRIGHRDQ